MARHWRHFFDREDADYDIAGGDDEIVLTREAEKSVELLMDWPGKQKA